jgi:hypothetical protein
MWRQAATTTTTRGDSRMVIPTAQVLSDEPWAHGRKHGNPTLVLGCGHASHVGTCPSCQRAALARAKIQLAAAQTARIEWSQR